MSRRAAEYVRMSTEHQQYSTANQRDCISAYAAAHDMLIVRSYADEGKSGVTIHGRKGLQLLLQDVVKGDCDFDLILVYDISRWGRFQDADESAHYEFLCKRAGLEVHYCAEQFANDGSPVSSIVKGMKRVMAAEYSRELSHKVYVGMVRITLLGYKTAGRAGYGLQRVLIGADGTRKALMKDGDRKQFQTDRVILEPGPPEQVEVVRKIFRWVSEEDATFRQVVNRLNAERTPYSDERPWTYNRVREIVTNEKYIGTNVYGRTSQKLSRPFRRLPKCDWIRREGAFEPLVEKATFDGAQKVIQGHRRLTDEVLLAQARAAFARYGRLSVDLVEQSGPHSYGTFILHFGSFEHLCELVGCFPNDGEAHIWNDQVLRRLRAMQERTIYEARAAGLFVQRRNARGRLCIQHKFVQFLAADLVYRSGQGCWQYCLRPEADYFVVLRPSSAGKEEDYFLFPGSRFQRRYFETALEEDGAELADYRFDSFDFLQDLRWSCREKRTVRSVRQTARRNLPHKQE